MSDTEAAMPPAYVFRDGLRHAVPYVYVWRSFAKRRWLGRQVAEVLTSEFPAVMSPAYLARAMAAGRLRINGRPCEAGAVFRDRDLLEHHALRREPPVAASDPREWIIAETASLVVVNKPATVPVHQSGRFHRNTVVGILAAECPDLAPTDLYPVHRLDRETSGLLLLARNAGAARRMCSAIAAGSVHKRYVAAVEGCFPEGTHVVDAPLAQGVRAGAGYHAVSPDGRPAVTECRRLRYCPRQDLSLVLCRPRTGRSHQIRIHLAWMGHPIGDDALYGGTRAKGATRNRLFDASRISLGEGGRRLAAAEAHAAPAAAAVWTGHEEGGGVGVEGETDESIDGAHIWLHALDYWSEDDAAGRWHYCAPLPDWARAFGVTAEDIGGGFAEPQRRDGAPDGENAPDSEHEDAGRGGPGQTLPMDGWKGAEREHADLHAVKLNEA